MSILRCESVSKYYLQGDNKVQVLNTINFSIAQGETVAIMGSSGAGKSTLLNLLGGLDTPSQGKVYVAEQCLSSLNNKSLSRLRNEQLGFVYQFHHLLQEFDALENVAMPLMIRGQKKQQAFEKAKSVLEQVGLAHRFTHRPQALSGGERQRVAIARAIVGEPACVLMDEPTGNLDEKTAADIQALLQQLNQNLNQSFVVVTHDKAIAQQQQRLLHLSQGELHEVG